MVKTKIVCTIGPVTESVSAINRLQSAGMNVSRINCSHGDHKQYAGFISNIKKVSKNIAILLDTQGPEVRSGFVKKGTILKEGTLFALTRSAVIGDETRVHVTYKGLVNDVKKNDKIFLDSGFLELKVLRKTKTDVICKVITGGPLGNQKSVNHPACLAKIPSFTSKDKKDLLFGIDQDIDFVAASFIRSAKDILKIKKFIKENSKKDNIKVFAKIENKTALENFEKILEVSDGIMVARGDLGVEVEEELIPLIQKDIIKQCNLSGKPVITATQMLESMVSNPRPTRAEVTDVSNAIFDGTDAIMLSEETAIGKYYSKAVKTMARIANNTESVFDFRRKIAAKSTDEVLAKAVHEIIKETNIKTILVATCSGFSAKLMSKYRPKANIIAVTPTDHVVRQMGLYWGIIPLMIKDAKPKSTRDLIFHAVKTAKERRLVIDSEEIVVLAAHPFNICGRTNLLEIHTVNDLLKLNN